MGRHAATAVIDQIEGTRKQPGHTKLDVELIVRESCSEINN